MGTMELIRAWDNDAGADRMAPGRVAMEGSASGGSGSGIIAGTRIATESGWQRAEDLAAGTRVLTFDSGLRRILEMTRGVIWDFDQRCPSGLYPLAVPALSLGNTAAMLLLPDQNVLIESELEEALSGEPFVLLPAAALAGYRGIDRIAPLGRTEIVGLRFAEDEIVYANGVRLIHCPRDPVGAFAGPGSRHARQSRPAYRPIGLDQARRLIDLLIADDADIGLGAA